MTTNQKELVTLRRDIRTWATLMRDFPDNPRYAATYDKLIVREAELVIALHKEYFDGKD